MQQLPDAVAGMLRLLDVLQRSALVRTTRCAFVLQLGAKQLFGLTKGPTGVFKSVLDTTRTDGKRRDEIYVDVVERLSMTFNAAGNPISCQIDGAIQVGNDPTPEVHGKLDSGNCCWLESSIAQ